MKNICFLSGDITRSGGTEKVACQIMNGLVDEFQVSVISLAEENDKMFYDLPEKIIRHSLFDKNPDGIKQFFSIVHRLRAYIKKNSIDVLIDIDTIMDMFSVPALIGLKTKLIAWEHFNFYETMGNRFRVPIRKILTRHADCIVTLTKEDQKNYQNYFKKKQGIVQIYNPVEIPKNNTMYNNNSKRIISAGRLAKQKGFDILIEVAAIVLMKHPDWEWYVWGEGEERSALEDMRQQKKLQQLHFPGKTNELLFELQKGAMYVMTSRYEGFPLVLIEAKSCQLPVVSFRCKTGPEELVQDGINGYLVECFDVQMMADKICELIEYPEMREKFSQNALMDTDKLAHEIIINKWKKLICMI